MEYFVYILQSESTGNYYIGQTQNIEQRLIKHNRGYVRSTKNRGPWMLIIQFPCTTRSDAMALEKKLKHFKAAKGYSFGSSQISEYSVGSVFSQIFDLMKIRESSARSEIEDFDRYGIQFQSSTLLTLPPVGQYG